MVQYADLEASSVKLPGRRSNMSTSQKRALFATLGALGCIAIVVMAVSFSSALPETDGAAVELASTNSRMDAASRMALRRGASEARLRTSEKRRSKMMQQFDALQAKIERDLGVRQPVEQKASRFPAVHAGAAKARAQPPRRMQMAMWNSNEYAKNNGPAAAAAPAHKSALHIGAEDSWEYEPESYGPSYGDAEASATLSASQAQDALHRILALEREAEAIHASMAARENDVTGARDAIDRELGAVYAATRKAEESLDHAAAVQNQAAEALSSAQDLRNEELHHAQRIAEIERRVEQEAAYVDHLVYNVQHSGGYANVIAKEAAYANHAVQSIHNYLEDSFTLTRALSETGNEARAKIGNDLHAASAAVGDLEDESAYGANAAAMSQHYAAAARLFAQHAAGAAQGAYEAVEGALRSQEASVQAAFQSVQAAKGAKVAEEVAESAREGAQAALAMARRILHHTYGYYGPQLPTDPVQRAEFLVDRMLPVLSRAADELERSEGDCQAAAQIFEEMRSDIQPITEDGENIQMTADQEKEVQSYADQALGSTLERLMVDMMKAVQQCGTDIVGENEEEHEAPIAPSATPSSTTNEEDDTYYNQPYDGGVPTQGGGEQQQQQQGEDESNTLAPSQVNAIINAKQLVDARVSVISNMIDKINAAMHSGDCQSIREETENARNDFNFFENEEMSVLQGMAPADIDQIDQYAQTRLMPLLQTSLDTFDRVKARCGREIFSDMPITGEPSGEYAVDADDYFDEQDQQTNNNKEQSAAPAEHAKEEEGKEVQPTALVVSSKLVIDHMVRSIDDLMKEVNKDASNCQAADNAGVAFKARFAALEHIALRYETRMNDKEKAEVEQYAEDKLGAVMEKLFTVVMQVTANCGTKSFDLLGAHDVEEFYEDEARHTLAERANDAEQAEENNTPVTNPYGEALPNGEPNPEAEETVDEMKNHVIELKKRLEDLRKKSGGDSSSGSSGSAASGSESGSGGSSAASGGSSAASSASEGGASSAAARSTSSA